MRKLTIVLAVIVTLCGAMLAGASLWRANADARARAGAESIRRDNQLRLTDVIPC